MKIFSTGLPLIHGRLHHDDHLRERGKRVTKSRARTHRYAYDLLRFWLCGIFFLTRLGFTYTWLDTLALFGLLTAKLPWYVLANHVSISQKDENKTVHASESESKQRTSHNHAYHVGLQIFTCQASEVVSIELIYRQETHNGTVAKWNSRKR